MKIRKGFVSNSSSSSFTCELCGNTESGWDCGLEEVEMWECENGHTLCESHLIGAPTLENIQMEWVQGLAKKSDKDLWFEKEDLETIRRIAKVGDYDSLPVEDRDFMDEGNNGLYDDIRYYLPARFCPICALEHVTEDTIIRYLVKKANTTSEAVSDEIKKQFKSLIDVNEFLNG